MNSYRTGGTIGGDSYWESTRGEFSNCQSWHFGEKLAAIATGGNPITVGTDSYWWDEPAAGGITVGVDSYCGGRFDEAIIT